MTKKILIGTPIIDKKMYSWKQYVEGIKGLKLPDGYQAHVLIVDTSDEPNTLKIPVQDEHFFYVHFPAERPMDKVVGARNVILANATAGGYDYVFFVDSDVMVPTDALITLFDHPLEYQIISGFYPGMDDMGLPTATGMRYNGFTYVPLKEHELKGTQKVDLIGLGCALIHKDLFKLQFRCERGPFKSLLKSEDMCYCEDLRKAGITIYFDTDVICKHKIEEGHWNPDVS